MIFFIFWVVFLISCILSVAIAAVMSNRAQGDRAASPTGESTEPMFDSGEDEGEAFEAVEEFEAVESFAADDGQASDDFASLDQEFK